MTTLRYTTKSVMTDGRKKKRCLKDYSSGIDQLNQQEVVFDDLTFDLDL